MQNFVLRAKSFIKKVDEIKIPTPLDVFLVALIPLVAVFCILLALLSVLVIMINEQLK